MMMCVAGERNTRGGGMLGGGGGGREPKERERPYWVAAARLGPGTQAGAAIARVPVIAALHHLLFCITNPVKIPLSSPNI